MTCPKCNYENPTEARFCMQCGSPQASACPSCAAELPPAAKFCMACGEPAAGRAAAPAPPATSGQRQRFESPELYTPRHLAERILTSRSALEGERKLVTVLFADIRGSMELLAESDPEDARMVLDPVLERMMDAVHRYEGTVNQVMGDGIMAIFGAPLAHEDHAIRACRAALRMRETISALAQKLHEERGLGLETRIGLNSGNVIVRSIGNDLRMDYSAVGETTHLAARMEQMAAPGSIFATDSVARLTSGHIATRPLGRRAVKGVEAPMELFEVLGAGPHTSRLHASAESGLTPFVGRDAELQELGEALTASRSGHGEVVALIGEPGVGKSRLTWEFGAWATGEGCHLVEGRSLSYEQATPFLPIIGLLKSHFQIDVGDGPAEIRAKLVKRLRLLDLPVEEHQPPLEWLLDVPAESVVWEALAPAARQQKTFTSLRSLLLAESLLKPLVVTFEDLHWIDAETEEFLDRLVESLPATRILLVVNYRPEYHHSWENKSFYRRVWLRPLSGAGADALLDHLLGQDPTLASLKRTLIGRTGGNPFFLEESVRTLLETGFLQKQKASFRMAGPPEDLDLPATAQGVLAARIDRLTEENKRVLQAAAVIGKRVPLDLLRAISEPSAEVLGEALGALCTAEFLDELGPDGELFGFRHALTHEVAYAGLLRSTRRSLHARIVDAMERLYADGGNEHVDQLAEHSFRGEVWDRAVPYLRHAAQRAAERAGFRQAVVRLDQALEALGHLPESRQSVRDAIDLRLQQRSPLQALGQFERLVETLRTTEQLADSIGDLTRLAQARGYLTQFYVLSGDPVRALEMGQAALEIAESIEDLDVKVLADFNLGLLFLHLGDYPKAIEFHRRTTSRLAGDLSRETFGMTASPAILSRTWLAWAHAERGEFEEALANAEQGILLAVQANTTYGRIYADCGLGYVCLRQGDAARVVEILEPSLRLCLETDIRVLRPFVSAMLGSARVAGGDLDTGVPMIEDGVETATALRLAFGRAFLLGLLGDAFLASGRTDDAEATAKRALELVHKHQERGYEAWIERLLGRIYALQAAPDPGRAAAHLRSALATAETLEMQPLAEHCRRDLSGLEGRQTRVGAERS